MTESHPPSRTLPRRRRANAAQARTQLQPVRVSEEEKKALLVRAAEQNVSVSRLLVESALADGEAPEGRRAVMAELFELRRLLATVANNVNQVAKAINISGTVSDSAAGTLADARDVMARIDVALDQLRGPPAVMPNITRGGDMGGVVRYLIGHGKEEPGKPGAHTEPHLVAGSPAVMAFWGADELHPNQAGAIAAELDHPRRVFGTSVTVPKKDAEGHVVGRRDAHVWHCSLSLRPDEAALSDERWAHIAEDFVAGMGFDDGQAAACRWAAVHHGLSKAGNDHIHIVVGLVREDGSKARVNRDQPRAQRLAGELERKYGLQVLESRESGHTSRGYTPRDQERDEAGRDWAPAMGTERTDRGRLERTVRACATAAGTEADFVRLLRFHGLRVKPRFAAGRGGPHRRLRGGAPASEGQGSGVVLRGAPRPRSDPAGHPRVRRVGRHAGGEHRRGGGVDRRGPAATRRRYDPATQPRPRAVAARQPRAGRAARPAARGRARRPRRVGPHRR